MPTNTELKDGYYMWSNTLRGAQFLDASIPRLIRALERIADALEQQNKGDAYKRGLWRAHELVRCPDCAGKITEEIARDIGDTKNA